MKHSNAIIHSSTLATLMSEYMDDFEIGRIFGCKVVIGQFFPIAQLPVGWYEVSWPEHVTWPRYNSDANYLGKIADNAIELSDEQMDMLRSDDWRRANNERMKALIDGILAKGKPAT